MNVLRGRGPLVICLLALVAATAAVVESQRGFIDLAVYRFGGRSVLDGIGLYVAGDPTTGLPFTYPPFAALLMVPIALLPAVVAASAWAVASVLALAGTLTVFLRSGGSSAGLGRVVAITGLALLLEPVWASLSFGQVNLFLMLAVSLDLLRPERRWAGVLVGVAAGIKLTPLVFVVLLVLVGRRTAAGRAVVTFAATVAVGFVAMPSAAVSYWTDVLWDPSRVGGVEFTSNQSVPGVLTRLLGAEPPTLLWLAIAGPLSLGILLVAAVWWRRGARDLGLCLGAISMLLASPISWSHHWVWAAPIALVLARILTPLVTAAWLVVFASACIWWPPHREGRELGWSLLDQTMGNAYLWAGLAFAAYALVQLRAPSIIPVTSPSAIRPPAVPGAV